MTVRRHRGRGEGPRGFRAFERTRERAKHSAQARRAGQVQRAGRRPEGKRSAQAEGRRSQPHAVEEPPAGSAKPYKPHAVAQRGVWPLVGMT